MVSDKAIISQVTLIDSQVATLLSGLVFEFAYTILFMDTADCTLSMSSFVISFAHVPTRFA